MQNDLLTIATCNLVLIALIFNAEKKHVLSFELDIEIHLKKLFFPTLITIMSTLGSSLENLAFNYTSMQSDFKSCPLLAIRKIAGFWKMG